MRYFFLVTARTSEGMYPSCLSPHQWHNLQPQRWTRDMEVAVGCPPPQILTVEPSVPIRNHRLKGTCE